MSKIRKVEYPFSPFDILIKLINTIVFSYLFVITLNLDIPVICSVFIALVILCFIVGIVDDVAFLIKDIKREKSEYPTEELEAHEAFGATLDDTMIRTIIKNNNIEDLKSLLKLLGYPKIEYKEFDYTQILDADEKICDYRYHIIHKKCFNSTFSNGEYKELREFEEKFYPLAFNWQDFYHYNKSKRTFYCYLTYCTVPEIAYEDNIAHDDTYKTCDELMEHMTKED